LTYANVTATIALAGVIGGGAAWAAGKIGSGDIRNNSVRSADLKNHRAVGGRDVRPDTLKSKQVDEASLKASEFAPLSSNIRRNCDPSTATFVDCATTTVRLRHPGRLLLIGTGEFVSSGAPASVRCGIGVDGAVPSEDVVSPGESATDNTDIGATQGFAMTRVSDRLGAGTHHVALQCAQPSVADGLVPTAELTVLGLNGG
jgi:hypothetical protein